MSLMIEFSDRSLRHSRCCRFRCCRFRCCRFHCWRFRCCRRLAICALVSLTTLIPAAFSAATAAAADWGDLSGRFVLDGPAPERSALKLDKDVEYCGKSGPLDESLIVDPESHGIANVVISLDVKRGVDGPAIHPDYAKLADSPVRVTNRNCRFEPRVTVLRLGQPLLLGNDDPIAHNTLANLAYNQPFNEAVTKGQSIEKTFSRAESKPAEITCPIHAWMKGYVVIKEHPYVAVTDSAGRFTIRNLPAGEWTFQFWHESSKYVTQAELSGRQVEDRKGLYTLTIQSGKNELGDIVLQPALFE